ncbi:MAG: protein kinase [Actinomycetota bacterium]
MVTDRIGDYDIIQTLGEGAAGTALLARCPGRLQLGSDHVVVKVLNQHATDDGFDLMAEELHYLARIMSPNLVALHEAGLQGDMLFYSCDYCPDGSLAQPARPFTRAAVLASVADAAIAAHALHEAGVAHRSIKPGNVLIDGHRAKLTDPGLNEVLNPGRTNAGMNPYGSMEYQAPELIQGDGSSRASDIWALGATLHRVLTGRPVYPDLPDDSTVEALRYLLHARPKLHESLRPEEHDVIGHALDVDPAERPPTAMAFARSVAELAQRYARSDQP